MSVITELPEILKESKKVYEQLSVNPMDLIEEFSYGTNFAAKSSAAENMNMLFHGDNLHVLANLIKAQQYKGKVKMIYIDPPFFSKADYNAVVKVKQKNVKCIAYHDKWENGLKEYLKMLTVRLFAMRELLKEDGLIWVHLDWHVVHYVKVIMDEVFGENNFVNEIIWNYKSGGTSKTHFARKHDTLLLYSKSDGYSFYPLKEKSYNRGLKPYRFKGVKEYEDDMGWYTMVNMKDVWNIDMVGRTSSERTGYATQKPEQLLKRIIESSTREGDICADFFCGSGTLAAVASKTGRNFLCCDQGSLAVQSTITRLNSLGASFKVFEEHDDSMDNISKTFEVDFSVKKSTAKKTTNIKIVLNGIMSNTGENLPLDTLQSWSVDFSYDGKVHRPDIVMSRIKNDIQTELEFDKINGSVSKSKNEISIKFSDVFGNVKFERI